MESNDSPSETEALVTPASSDNNRGSTPTIRYPSYSSYQHNPPAVQQLDDVLLPRKHAYYGDATLQPNTGLTNSYDYALFGLALHELLDRLRLSIIVNALLMFVLLLFTWWTRLFRPFHLVLSIVLAVLVFVMLVVEVKSIFDSVGGHSASTTASTSNGASESNRATFAKILKFTEQVGLKILYHPIGRTLYLIACGSFCFWIGGVWEAILGLMFVTNAGVLLYCWVTYPEFRQTFSSAENNNDRDDEGESSQSYSARSASWSYYSQTAGVVSGNTSIIHNTTMNKQETR